MISEYINKYKNKKFFFFLLKIAFLCISTVISVIFSITAYFRNIGIGGEKYKAIKKYKGINSGKRCFIIAMGPSLLEKDLIRLKNEYTFGMNSICTLYESIDFKPTYYGIQDKYVFDDLKQMLYEYYLGNDRVFISDRIARNKKIDPKWTVFPLNYAYNAYARWFKNDYKVKASDDAFKVVYDGFSITISLIQIAIYMGFCEIYLLGADCSFDKANLHFGNYTGIIDPTLDTAYQRNIAGYKGVKELAESKGVKIYNATRGGCLEVFERVSIDEVLSRG